MHGQEANARVLGPSVCDNCVSLVNVDPAFRTGYRIAHALLRSYWFVRRPRTNGSLTAIWKDGKILLVKTAYRRQHQLPGGYVRPGEDPRYAASRELREELNLHVSPDDLELAYHGTLTFEHRRDTLDIYECHVTEEPDIQVDDREVIWAGFIAPAEAMRMDIVPHLREYLEQFV